MKKFLLKAGIFVCGLVVIFGGCIFVSSKSELFNVFFSKITNSSSYSRNAVDGGPQEIIPAIERAQEESGHTKLVLGDSVGHRVFAPLREANDEYLILTTNQAIGMMGQYLLAEQFIKSHDEATDIYVVMIAGSFATDFSTKYGYQYAVMPFVEMDIFQNLDDETIKAAEDTYGKVFMNKDAVNIIDYSDMNRKIYLNLIYEYGKGPVSSGKCTSDIGVRNMMRLRELCEANDINLHILPGPMPDTERNRNLLDAQKKEFVEKGMGEMMQGYYDCVTLYPEKYFPDGIHPGGEYGTQEIKNEMIMDIQEKSGSMEGLVFSEE